MARNQASPPSPLLDPSSFWIFTLSCRADHLDCLQKRKGESPSLIKRSSNSLRGLPIGLVPEKRFANLENPRHRRML